MKVNYSSNDSDFFQGFYVHESTNMFVKARMGNMYSKVTFKDRDHVNTPKIKACFKHKFELEDKKEVKAKLKFRNSGKHTLKVKHANQFGDAKVKFEGQLFFRPGSAENQLGKVFSINTNWKRQQFRHMFTFDFNKHHTLTADLSARLWKKFFVASTMDFDLSEGKLKNANFGIFVDKKNLKMAVTCRTDLYNSTEGCCPWANASFNWNTIFKANADTHFAVDYNFACQEKTPKLMIGFQHLVMDGVTAKGKIDHNGHIDVAAKT
jgi:hypothetical protein